MSRPLDAPAPIRAGEELDQDALTAYFARECPELGALVSIAQFPSGHSNLTYALDFEKAEAVLRRPPIGARVKSGHDMVREHRFLARIGGAYAKVPDALHACEDEAVIGAPFSLLSRVEGVILRGARGARDIEPAAMERLSRSLIQNLAAIHAIDKSAAGLDDWGRPQGYVQRQVQGWTGRYEKARTDPIPDMEKVAAILEERRPEESAASVVHNDFKYDNMVFDPELKEVVAVLDWEMATVGDPLMDLGTSLGYWSDQDDKPELRALPFGPTAQPGNLQRKQLVEEYARARGTPVPDAAFYYAFGLFKIAVIAQQIYQRFHLGVTKDPRFAGMIMAVKVLSAQAMRALEKNRVDALG